MDSKNSKRLVKEYGKVETYVFYKIKNKILFSQNETALVLGVTSRSLKKYREAWLKEDELSINLLPMFDIVEAIDGYRDNVNKKHREEKNQNIEDKGLPEDIVEYIKSMKKWESVPLHLLPKDEIERRISVKEFVVKDVKAKIVTEEVIDANKVDFAKAESAVTTLSFLRSLKKLLPMLLDGKKSHEITKILDEQFSKMVKTLHEFVNIKIPEDADSNFWDIIALVIKLLQKGTTPKEIIKRLDV